MLRLTRIHSRLKKLTPIRAKESGVNVTQKLVPFCAVCHSFVGFRVRTEEDAAPSAPDIFHSNQHTVRSLRRTKPEGISRHTEHGFALTGNAFKSGVRLSSLPHVLQCNANFAINVRLFPSVSPERIKSIPTFWPGPSKLFVATCWPGRTLAFSPNFFVQ